MLPLDNKKLNEIAKLEKAIKERWGDEAIKTPQSDWDETKEKEYKEQQKEFAQKIQSNDSESLEDACFPDAKHSGVWRDSLQRRHHE